MERIRHTVHTITHRRLGRILASVLICCLIAGTFGILPVQAAEPTMVSGDWDTKTTKLDDFSGHAYILDEPIYDCEKLKIAVSIEMNAGARVKDWTVYAKDRSWKAIGSLYLPGGDGDTEDTLYLSRPMDVRAVMVVPSKRGSYSWSIGVGVYSYNETTTAPPSLFKTPGEEPVQISGDWDNKTTKLDDFSGHAFILDEPLYDCEKLKVAVEIEMKGGSHCENWTVYAKDREWKAIGSLYLPGGDGKAEETIRIRRPMDVRAVMVVPDKIGSYSWSISIAVYAFGQSAAPEAKTPTVSASETLVPGSWDNKTTKLENCNGHAYILDEPIYNCEKLRIDLSVEMKGGAHCDDWTVYAKGSGGWKSIGSICLPGGDGDTTAYVRLWNPMTVKAIMVVPTINGSYSWSIGYDVYDVR